MANKPPLPLLFLTTLISLTTSQLTPTTTQLFLPLTHTLSHSPNTTTSTHHLLKSSSLRSLSRHRHRQISLPLAPGSDYTLSLSLGSTAIALYMDTGSDLVWFPCSPFACILCEGKPVISTPLPPPASSSLVPCASPLCSAAHSSSPASDLCAAASCPLDDIETSSCSSSCPQFYYAYGDGSLVGRLRTGSLFLHGLRISNFAFACAHSALAETVGVAGFGRGALSLPTQLAAVSPSLASRFSYCLISHSFVPARFPRPSPLILGRIDNPDETQFTYTPMLHNPKHPYFYSVSLEAISIGRTRIPTRPNLSRVDQAGNGGMVVDSGTTFTMLPAELHARVAREFDREMRARGFVRAARAEKETGLNPCYFSAVHSEARRVPSFGLHFGGNAIMALPRRNYFIPFQLQGKGVGCLTVMRGWDGEGGSDGPAATLGNYQQQGFEVVYDLSGRRVGFARRQCGQLWDSVSRG